jgi:hypothetical protein
MGPTLPRVRLFGARQPGLKRRASSTWMSLFLSKVAPQTGIVDIFFRDENRPGRPLRLKRLALEVADNDVKYKSSHGVWILPDRRVLRSLTDAIERQGSAVEPDYGDVTFLPGGGEFADLP